MLSIRKNQKNLNYTEKLETALQVTQLLTNIVVILLFGGILVVLINLIKYTKKLSKKVETISKDFSEVKPKLLETVEKVNFLADSLTTVTKNVNNNIDVLGTVVDKVKDTAESLIEFEQKIQNTIEPPVMETLNTITAVSVGVKTFFEALKRSKSHRLVESDNYINDDSNDYHVNNDSEDITEIVNNDEEVTIEEKSNQ